jgi:hypothetical protein
MRLIRQLVLVLALVAGPSLATAHDELGREPRGPDSLDPGTPIAQAVGTVTGRKAFPAGAIK